MIRTDEWLPVGSVVHVEGAEGLFMIIGYMVGEEGAKGLWDYAGVRYPVGTTGPDDNVMFDRDGIDGIFYVGFQNEEGEHYQDLLTLATDEFEKAKSKARGEE